mmetsp:Transcript_19983/g.63234  ORF Transcript_19983/g.63234 Transcript_19983/m.63234 type:complete len:607 (-) Transcript_19983:112-1932(-)
MSAEAVCGDQVDESIANADGNGVEKAGDGVDAIHRLLSQLGLMCYFDKFVESGFDTMAAVELMNETDMREECGMTPDHVKALQKWLHERQCGSPSVGAAAAPASRLTPPTAGAAMIVPPPANAGTAALVQAPAIVPAAALAPLSATTPVAALASESLRPLSAMRSVGSIMPPASDFPTPPNEFIRAHVAKLASQVLGGSQLVPAGAAGSMPAQGAAASLAAAMEVRRPGLAGPASTGLLGGSEAEATPLRPSLLPGEQLGRLQAAAPAELGNLPACLRGGIESLPSRPAMMPPVKLMRGQLGSVALNGGLGSAQSSGAQLLGGGSKVPPGVRAMLRANPQLPTAGPALVEEQLGDAVTIPAAATEQPNGAANTLYTLAQVAQESAQYAQQAAAVSANPGDAKQAAAMADAAEQAAQRAIWATSAVSACEQPDASAGQVDSYVASIKQICQQASETAEQAAATCRANATSAKALEDMMPSGPTPRGEKRSRVPCKFFESGMCQKGTDCPLSHNPSDKKPLPLWQKRQYLCTFFEEDKCIRGASCAFAHGQDELDMIKRFKAALKDENTKWAKPAKRPGDWDCPGCGDRQFARNGSCRKCGEARPLGV